MIDKREDYDEETALFETDRVPYENSVDPDVSKRLRDAVEHAGGPAQVARLSKLPLGSLRNYLRGRDIRVSALVALADACGTSLEWLATGRGKMAYDPADGTADFLKLAVQTRSSFDQRSLPADYVMIPRYNVAASAGNGASLVDNTQVVEYFAFKEEYLRLNLQRRPEDLALIEARGDSMEPTIRDGDVLTIDIRTDQAIENGRLYVIQVTNALLVKRVELRLTSIVLHSDNPRYSPETIDRTDAEQLHVVGRVLLVSTPPR